MRYDPDLVCICAKVKRCKIVHAIRNGTLGKLRSEGLSQYCGSCEDVVDELVEELSAQNAQE